MGCSAPTPQSLLHCHPLELKAMNEEQAAQPWCAGGLMSHPRLFFHLYGPACDAGHAAGILCVASISFSSFAKAAFPLPRGTLLRTCLVSKWVWPHRSHGCCYWKSLRKHAGAKSMHSPWGFEATELLQVLSIVISTQAGLLARRPGVDGDEG